MKKPAVIFDGDDTLWKTQPLYKAVIDQFYDVLDGQGFGSDVYRPLFASTNQELLRATDLPSNRLGRAMIGTYQALCRDSGTPLQSEIVQHLTDLAQQPFTRTPEPQSGVHEVLSLLRNDFDLLFYSAGEEATQFSRLTGLDLSQYFDGRVLVVARKNAQTLETLLENTGFVPSSTWMVGNSPRFDINPALQLGLRCVWLHSSFWRMELEDMSLGSVFGAFSLNEVANILYFDNGFGRSGYVPSHEQAKAFRSDLLAETDPKNIWVIGTSPKLDINPALSAGAKAIWMPTAFDADDVEPFSSSIYVAFTQEGAARIAEQWSNAKHQAMTMIWRSHGEKEDLGGSLIVD